MILDQLDWADRDLGDVSYIALRMDVRSEPSMSLIARLWNHVEREDTDVPAATDTLVNTLALTARQLSRGIWILPTNWFPALTGLAKHDDGQVRCWTLITLACAGKYRSDQTSQRIASSVEPALDDDDSHVRAAAMFAHLQLRGRAKDRIERISKHLLPLEMSPINRLLQVQWLARSVRDVTSFPAIEMKAHTNSDPNQANHLRDMLEVWRNDPDDTVRDAVSRFWDFQSADDRIVTENMNGDWWLQDVGSDLDRPRLTVSDCSVIAPYFG